MLLCTVGLRLVVDQLIHVPQTTNTGVSVWSVLPCTGHGMEEMNNQEDLHITQLL